MSFFRLVSARGRGEGLRRFNVVRCVAPLVRPSEQEPEHEGEDRCRGHAKDQVDPLRPVLDRSLLRQEGLRGSDVADDVPDKNDGSADGLLG